MTAFVHSFCSRRVLCIDSKKFDTIKELKNFLYDREKLPSEAYFFVCNGLLVEDSHKVQTGTVYHTHARILGGKGGFGSMLRAIGAQIEKTTNHEACRDLSGRRMRDVNTEKELKEWLAKQTEREKEREQRRQERIARRRAMPNHKFDDPLYDKQRSLLAENQEDALQKGLKRAFTATAPAASTSGSDSGSDSGAQSNQTVAGPSQQKKVKKSTEWLGVDIDDLSDSSSDDPGSPRPDSKEALPSNDDHKSGETMTEPGSSRVVQGTDTDPSDSGGPGDGETPVSGESVNGEAVSSDKDTGEVTEQQTDKEEEEEVFDLEKCSTATDLEKFGLERLKTELMARGLKCGGTLQERAERLFSVRGQRQDEIDPSLLAKPSKGKGKKKATSTI